MKTYYFYISIAIGGIASLSWLVAHLSGHSLIPGIKPYDPDQPETRLEKGWVEISGPRNSESKRITEQARSNQQLSLPTPSHIVTDKQKGL